MLEGSLYDTLSIKTLHQQPSLCLAAQDVAHSCPQCQWPHCAWNSELPQRWQSGEEGICWSYEQMVLGQSGIHRERRVNHRSTCYLKHLPWTTDLRVKHKTLKLLQDDKLESLQGADTNVTWCQKHSEENNTSLNWTLFKVKMLALWNVPLRGGKEEKQCGRKRLASHISNKRCNLESVRI